MRTDRAPAPSATRGVGRAAVRGHPLWRKAPFVLFRHPAMVLALAAGALLVVVTTAAYPLFLSASRDRIVETTLSDPTVTRYGAGVTYMASGFRLGEASPDGQGLLRQRRAELFDRAVAASPVLDDPLEQMMGAAVDVTGTDGRVPASGPVNGVLFAGTDALDHVAAVRGTDGPGAWLPDFVADPLGVGPGDTIELHHGAATVTVPVDGVYRALYAQPETGYWRIWHNEIYPCPQECPVPPQPILVDRSQLIRLMTTLRAPKATFAVLAPIRDGERLTLDQARALHAFSDHLQARMNDRASPFGSVFQCCGISYHHFRRVTNVSFLTAIPTIVHEAEQRTASIQGPLQVLVLAGLVIAFSVVAAAGAFALAARRVEIGVLVARGWRPIAAGAKASLEALLPCLIGGVFGFALATALIAAVGPGAAIETSARSAALWGSVSAVTGAILLVGTVSTLGFISRHERRDGVVRVLVWFPWELLAIGAAVLLDRRLRSSGGVVFTRLIQRPSISVFAFPIVLALAVSIPAARLLALAVSRRRGRGGRQVSGWYLASHRLASTSALAMLFLVASSLAISISIASEAMVSSLRTTVHAKAEVFVGSDVQLLIGPDTQVPDGFAYPATTAHRVLQAGYLHGTERSFDLVVIDPSTFASAAYWSGTFSSTPLPTLLDRLEHREDDALPVVVSNGQGIRPTAVDLEQTTVPIDVVATTSSFPGTSSDRPVLVVADDELDRAFAGKTSPLFGPNDSREMWIRGPAGPARSAAARAGVVSYRTITAQEVEAIPFIQAAIDTFVMMNILAGAALILVLVVSVVYLQARQRGRVLSSNLSRRMGLSRGTMRRSLVEELGALFLAALAIGGVAGWIGVGVVVPSVDPLGTIPPGPIVDRPIAALLVVAIPLAITAIVGGWVAERASRREALGEVLRVAE